LLAFLAVTWALASFLWSCIYLAFGLPLTASIPLAHSLFTAAGFVLFLRTRRYRLFLKLELIVITLLPFCVQLTLGGYRASGAIVIWSIMAPVAALLFDETRRAAGWVAAYAVMLAIAGVLDPTLSRHAAHLPNWAVITFFVLNLGTVTVIFWGIIRYDLLQRLRMQIAIEAERARSETLLLNILPPSIADRLKDGETVIADAHEEVTAVFADIVGFTPLSAGLPPEAVVGMLNGLYSAFDDLADRFGPEKIRTIGDSYFAVAGAPLPRPDHAQAAADFALALRDVVHGYRSEQVPHLSMRVGLNSGPAVAGVIGKRKFVYDLYGDTINTASRMESQGIPGEIQVSEATYLRLRDAYDFDPRGSIDVKGKGEMRTYLLRGRKADVDARRYVEGTVTL
jgi:guanylate cyclase